MELSSVTTMVFASFASYGVLSVLMFAFVLYIIARWRAHRDPVSDPQLGIKVAFGYFAVIAFHVALAGAALFIYAVISKSESDDKSSLYRVALALLVAGGGVLAAHIVLFRRTNSEHFPGVAKLVRGFNLFLTGTIGFASVVLACQALFAKGGSGELGRGACAMVVVYGSAWVAVAAQFARATFSEPAPPPPPPTNDGAPADGPKLPPLGGGSYPPLT